MENFENMNWEEFAPSPDNGELKKIQKNIRKRHFLVVLTSVLLVVALAVVVFYVCIPMVESQYWDPTVSTYSKYITDLSFTLRAYSELFVPEYTVFSADVAKTGFATYDLSLQSVDYRNSNEYSHYSAILVKDEFKVPEGLWEYCTIGTFTNDGLSQGTYSTLDSTIELLQQLPEYVKVRANVSFPEDKDMWEIQELEGWIVENGSPIRDHIDWIAIRHCEEGEDLYPLCGMKPYTSYTAHNMVGSINDRYPYFYINRYTKDTLEQHFTSLLQYSADQIVNGTGIVPEHSDLEGTYYQAVLDYVEEKGIYSYGCTLTATADMLLKLQENETISKIHILDIWIGF